MKSLKKWFIVPFILLTTGVAHTYSIRSLWEEMAEMREQMNDLFENVFQASPSSIDRISLQRDVRIDRNEDKIVITIELAGFTKEDIQVTVAEEKGTKYLVIDAERKEETKEEKKEKKDSAATRYYQASRNTFYYRYLLSGKEKEDGISAECKDGILTITIPIEKEKKEEPIRKINVK